MDVFFKKKGMCLGNDCKQMATSSSHLLLVTGMTLEGEAHTSCTQF